MGLWRALRDSLLLEAGFLGVLVAPLRLFRWRSAAWRPHDGVTFWLVRWLLFRLMFASGVVKLTSRCPTWWGLTGEGGAGTAPSPRLCPMCSRGALGSSVQTHRAQSPRHGAARPELLPCPPTPP